MAAVNPVTTTSPSLGISLRRAASRVTPEHETQRSKEARFRPALGKTTEAPITDEGIVALTSQPSTEASPISPAQPEQSVDAVVSEISDESVTLNCRSPASVVAVQLPLSLLPANLRIFGKPVKFSLIRNDGYRMPVITERPQTAFHPLAGEEEIDNWVSQL
jgi:hypothetical protein